MKQLLKPLLVATCLSFLSISPSFAQVTAVAEMQPSEISVTGTAQRTMAPTYAMLSLGLTSSDTSVTTAKASNDRIMSQLISNLMNQGIAKKDIYTSNISVNPDYNYDNGKRSVTSYSISNTVTVRINDLDKVSTIVGSAVQAGATEINSLSFKADIPNTLQDQLTIDALKDGRHNAEIMASALGRSLGPVKTASTYEPQTSSMDNGIRYAKVAAPLALSSATPVEEGSLIVTEQANITYYLQ